MRPYCVLARSSRFVLLSVLCVNGGVKLDYTDYTTLLRYTCKRNFLFFVAKRISKILTSPKMIVSSSVISCIIPLFLLNVVECHNKYSADVNEHHKEDTPPSSLKTLDKPFRMAKLNKLWTKSQIRLSEPKLQSLYGELKLHDKEEITWKKLKSEGKDKEGLKEAELRRKLIRIMDMYGLLQHFEDVSIPSKQEEDKLFHENSDKHINKSLFKDKKLNKLWQKAESSGFSSQELQALREEFGHHQDKIDEYYSILHDAKDGSEDTDENSIDDKLERFNSLNGEETTKQTDYIGKANLLRDKHRDLRDGYDRLHRLAAKGPNSKEFIEPKVQGLWKMAIETNFGVEELESIRIELLHYENRLLKLRHLQAENAFKEQKHRENDKMSGVKSDAMQLIEDNIKKQSRKVEKMHLAIETKIMQKHIEL